MPCIYDMSVAACSLRHCGNQLSLVSQGSRDIGPIEHHAIDCKLGCFSSASIHVEPMGVFGLSLMDYFASPPRQSGLYHPLLSSHESLEQEILGGASASATAAAVVAAATGPMTRSMKAAAAAAAAAVAAAAGGAVMAHHQQQQLPGGLATPQPAQRIKRTAKRAGAMHRCFSQRNLAGEW